MTADEQDLYAELVEGGLGERVRLEQERVDWGWVELRLALVNPVWTEKAPSGAVKHFERPG